MEIPFHKKIAFISTPMTFLENWLSTFVTIPIGVLKIISFLKKNKNEVYYIDMHSTDSWRDEKDPLYFPKDVAKFKKVKISNKEFWLYIAGKDFEYLEEELRKIKKIDEIWITCSFTCDYEIVKKYIDISKKIYPNVIVRVGGDFVRSFPELGKKLSADYVFTERIKEADLSLPDYSIKDKWDYGLFQLQLGCVNRCSFCSTGKDFPQKFEAIEVIDYMKNFYLKYKPLAFWNWDPNLLLYRDNFLLFLKLYKDSKMNVPLKFGKGLQVNFITDEILENLKKVKVDLITLPIECASYRIAYRIKKPYTIISTIKALYNAKKKGINMKSFLCTWVIGYPDDDISSFFRIFLSILKFGARPAPFPVFLFPGSADYVYYYKFIKNKNISELHGQIWPLINDNNKLKYVNLLKFLRSYDLKEAKSNLFLLDEEFKNLLLNEINNIDKFIELCLNSNYDSYYELNKIEKEIKYKKKKNYANYKQNYRK